MFRLDLPEGNGRNRKLVYLILTGYVLLIFALLVFVIVSTVHEIRHF